MFLSKCSPALSHITQFDDIPCSNRCLLPTTYRSFVFDSASDWQVVNDAALPAAENEYLAVTSQPNALMSESFTPVSFGSVGQGFTFTATRFLWSTFSTDGSPDVIFFINGTTATGSLIQYNVTVSSGINIAPVRIMYLSPLRFAHVGRSFCKLQYMQDYTTDPSGQAWGFTNLVSLSFAAYSQYNPSTKTGIPAILIFDDIALVKHIGGQF